MDLLFSSYQGLIEVEDYQEEFELDFSSRSSIIMNSCMNLMHSSIEVVKPLGRLLHHLPPYFGSEGSKEYWYFELSIFNAMAFQVFKILLFVITIET